MWNQNLFSSNYTKLTEHKGKKSHVHLGDVIHVLFQLVNTLQNLFFPIHRA